MFRLTIQSKDNGLTSSVHSSKGEALTALYEQQVIEGETDNAVYDWWIVDESPTEQEQLSAHAESLGQELATFLGQ